MRFWKFICKSDTEAECFQRKLFGDTGKMEKEVREVKPGDILFLYNIETDTLFGPFKAESSGTSKHEPLVSGAWKGRFPCQVKVSWDVISIIVDASRQFKFLREQRLRLKQNEGELLLKKMSKATSLAFISEDIKRRLQELDGEIHSLAHRIEEVRTSSRLHPADREVEIDRLKGEFYSKMRDFVWAVRRLDRRAGILNLPSNR